MVWKRDISSCPVSGDLDGKLYHSRDACGERLDLASGCHDVYLWHGDAVPEWNTEGGWSVSFLPGS